MKTWSSVMSGLLVLVLAACAQAAQPVSHTTAYPSKTVDNRFVRYTPMVGEKYQIAVEYELNVPAPAYEVDFYLGAEEMSFTVPAADPQHLSWYANFGHVPLDGPIPFSVVIDPAGAIDHTPPTTANHRLVSGFLSPRPPSQAIDYYDPRTLVGTQETTLTFGSGKVEPLTFMSGRPDLGPGQEPDQGGSVTGQINQEKPFPVSMRPDMNENEYQVYYTELVPFVPIPVNEWPLPDFLPIQEVEPGSPSIQGELLGLGSVRSETASAPALTELRRRLEQRDSRRHSMLSADAALGMEYHGPAWLPQPFDGTRYSFVQQFSVKEYNQRVDANKLRLVTWADVDAVQSTPLLAYYTQPESVVQSDNPKFAAFVTSVLGPDYRQNYTPYDAARKMFQTVVARSTYFYPQPGQEDLRAQTALDMLEHPLGDCGSFTMVLVATFRSMGLPARTAVGAWAGKDAGHAWSELYFPGYDWVIADGSMSDSIDPDGTFAYYFGIATDRNERMVMSRGNTFTTPDGDTASWLQNPAVWWTGNAPLQSWTGHTTISFQND